MSRDEATVQCGTWSQPHNNPHDTTYSLHSTSSLDRTANLSMASSVPSASSGHEQTNFDRVTAFTPAALINEQTNVDTLTAVLGGTDHSIGHESVASNEMDLSIQTNVAASNHERLTTLAPSGTQLTAVNLEIHDRTMTALASDDNSVAAWLDGAVTEHPLGTLDWSRLVASDPLAADIEAADVVDAQDGQAERGG